jgi:hypothetical protein
MATWTLAVITTVERLWPQDDLAGGTFYFGVNLQTAMVGTPSTTDADFLRLEPWNWRSLDGMDFGVIIGGTSKPLLQGGATGSVLQLPGSAPVVQVTNAVNAIKKRRATMVGLNGPAPFVWDDGEQTPAQPPPLGFYHHLMGSIGLLSGAMAYTRPMPAGPSAPVALNLTAVVTIQRSQIDPSFMTGGSISPGLLLVSAPRFTANDGTQYTPVAAGPGKVNGQQYYRWSYDPAAANPAAAYVVPISLDPGPPDPTPSKPGPLPTEFLNLNTYWVRKQVPTGIDATGNPIYPAPIDPGSTDWHLRLANGIADAWNVTRHLLDAANAWVAVLPADAGALWATALAGLRDRAGMGLWPAPDGDSLVSLALKRSRPATSSTDIAKDIVSPNWVERLRLVDRMTSLQAWQQQLTGALNIPPANLPAVGPKQTALVEVTWLAGAPATGTIRATLERADAPDDGANWAPVGPEFTNLPLPVARVGAGQTVAFKLSLAARPVRAGWFRGNSPDVTGRTTTRAVRVDSALSDLLAPIAAANASLQKDDAVADVVYALWDRASSTPLAIPVGGQSARSFMTVLPPVVPNTSGQWQEQGALALDDGKARAVTVANVALALPNDLNVSIPTWLPRVVSVWLPQMIKVTAGHDADTYQLTLGNGGPSVTAAYGDSATILQTKLEPLVGGPGTVFVTPAPSVTGKLFTVRMTNPATPQLTAAGISAGVVATAYTVPARIGMCQGFTLQLGSNTTAAFPFATSAADVQHVLERFSNVGAGKVAVAMAADGTGAVTTYTITFTDQNQPEVVPGVPTDSTQSGYGLTAAVPKLLAVSADGGAFTLTIGSQTTAAVPASAKPAPLATLLQDAFQNLGVGPTIVTPATDDQGNLAFSISFPNAGPDLGQITASAGPVGVTVALLLTVTGANPGSTYFLSVGDHTITAPGLAFNAGANDIRAALEKLINVGPGKVAVSPYGTTGGVFRLDFQDKTLPQPVATGTGVTVSVSTLVTVTPPSGKFALTVGSPNATATQTVDNLPFNRDPEDLRAALANAVTQLPAKPNTTIVPGVVVSPVGPAPFADPSGATLYAITFSDPTITLAAAGAGNVTASVQTYWGNYSVVAQSVPSVATAATFLTINASLSGVAGHPANNRLQLTVVNPTLTGTGSCTAAVPVADPNNRSHSLRLTAAPVDALMVHVGLPAGTFTLTNTVTGASAPVTVGAAGPDVRAAIVIITGLSAAQVSVTAATQTDGSVVYTAVSQAPLPAISVAGSAGVQVSASALLEAKVWANFASPTSVPTDWRQVNFNQSIFVPRDQVRTSAIFVSHGVAGGPLPGSELLQLVAPTYFTSGASTLLADLGTKWDSLGPDPMGNPIPAPLDRTGAFWQSNKAALRAVIPYASPRRRLALGQTGRLWPVWNHNDPTKADLRAYIESQIGDAANRGFLPLLADQRFGWSGADVTKGPYLDFLQDFPAPLPAVSSALASAIGFVPAPNPPGFLQAFADHLVKLRQLIPPNADQLPGADAVPLEQPADLVPTARPHAFNLLVDRFDAETTAPAVGSDDDTMRHLAGFGVLLRQASRTYQTGPNPFANQPWRMLNLADLSAPDTTTPGLIDPTVQPVTAGAVGPARLYHRDGARHNIISYDNQYLVARSPLADVAAGKGFQDQLAFVLVVGGANGSFALTLTPTASGTAPPPVSQTVTLDAAGQPSPQVSDAVATLLTKAAIAGTRIVTQAPGANGTTVYTIYLSVARPVPVLSVSGVTVGVTANLAGSPDEDTNSAVLRYDPPALSAPPGLNWGRLVSLKFGQMYEARVFMIGNCGAMPKELAPSHPVLLQPGPGATDPDENVVRRLLYLRRVGVSAPRLVPGRDLATLGEPSDAAHAPSGLPNLPAGLTPLAKELGLHVLSPNLPVERFFFDTSGRVGQLNPGSQWTLTLPRVAATGDIPKVDTDPGAAVQWQLRFGLLATDAYGNIIGQFSLLVVRAGTTLTLTSDPVLATENPGAALSTTLTTRVQVVVVQGAAGSYALSCPGPSGGTLTTGPVAFSPPTGDWERAADAEIQALQTALCSSTMFNRNGVVAVDGFHNAGASLFTVTPAGDWATQTLPPLQGSTGATTASVWPNQLFGGPIDVQLRRIGSRLSFGWRRSDRDEPWTFPPSVGWDLTTADQGLEVSRCFIQVALGDPAQPTATFGIPTVNTAGIAGAANELAPPPENEPITVLTPPFVNGDTTVAGGTLTFALRPPAVDLQTWARWYDMDLHMSQGGADPTVRKNVWTVYQLMLPVTEGVQQNQTLDLSFDDPAVCGLLFELVPLLVEPTAQLLTVTGTAGTFQLSCGGTTADHVLNASTLTAADVQSALQSLPAVGANGVVVTRVPQAGSMKFAITSAGALAGEFLPPIQPVLVSTGLTVSVQPPGPVAPTDKPICFQQYCDVVKSQLITARLADGAPSGTFSLSLNGQATPAITIAPGISAQASAQDVQAKIESLTGIGQGNVRVTAWAPVQKVQDVQNAPTVLNYNITGIGDFGPAAVTLSVTAPVSFPNSVTLTFRFQSAAVGVTLVYTVLATDNTPSALAASLATSINATVTVDPTTGTALNALVVATPAGGTVIVKPTDPTIPFAVSAQLATGPQTITVGGPLPGLPPVLVGTMSNVQVIVRGGRDTNGLPYYVQSAPFIVNVQSTPNAPRLDWDKDRQITIQMAEQEIWELRVYPAVNKSWFLPKKPPGAQRFHSRFGECATPNSGASANSFGTPGDRVNPGVAAPYYLFTPWRMTIEVATEQVLLLGPLVLPDSNSTPWPSPYLPLPTSTKPATPLATSRLQLAQALAWQAIQPQFDGQSISATFDKTAAALISNPNRDPNGNTTPPALATNCVPGDPRRYRYANTFQLFRQVWRWEGRPVPELPFEAASFVRPPAGLAMDPSRGPDGLPKDPIPSECAADTAVDLYSAVENLQLWDAVGFGDRSGVDLLGQTTAVGYGTGASTLFVENLTQDTRSLYYRFNAELFSRYAALFQPSPPFLTAAGYDPFARAGQDGQPGSDRARGSVTPWRRQIVPCRWTGDVPRPVVRFIVPLTQPDDADAPLIQATGTTAVGSGVITGLAGARSLAVGMAVTAACFPSETVVQSVDSDSQVTASLPATAAGPSALTFSSADADPPVRTTGTTTAGNAVITGLSPTLELTAGMVVTAACFPPETLILSVDPNNHDVTASRPATAGGATALTFFVNPAMKTPGLLLVLDETALITGGLAETIEADVVRVDDTYNGQAPLSRPEFGPDPTLRARGWVTTAANFPPPEQAVAMNVVGPLGHTFDTANAPLFVTSSYFVHPPQMDVNPVDDPSLAWYLIKARFRRLLVPEGQLGYLPLQQDNDLTPTAPQKLFPLPSYPNPLPKGQDWVVSVPEVTFPVGANATLTLGLEVPNPSGSFCTVKVTSTAPAAGALGTLTLEFDRPAARATCHWVAGQPAPGLDLRFVFQRDVSTQPAEPTVVSVKGPAGGTFTINYNGRVTATLAVGADALTVQNGLIAIGALVRVSAVPNPTDPATTDYTIDVEDNSNPVIAASGDHGAQATVAAAQAPPTLHFTVSYRLRTATVDSTANVWQTLQAARWITSDGNWPTRVVATATVGEVHVRTPRTLPALVSPFTAPYWVQFLANTQRLIPADTGSYQLTWLRGPSPGIPAQFNLLNAQGGTGDFGISANVEPEPGADVGFARVLLLTQVVRDVTGRLGPERYMGLFYLSSDGSTFVCQHRSPALPQNVAEECGISPLTARVVEVQARFTPFISATNKWSYSFPRIDFWADIFGDPKNSDTTSAADAVARIVGVSAPVSLTVRLTAPVISGINPSGGPSGTKVTITGSGFTFTTSVTVGGTVASSLSVQSDSQLTAVVPEGSGTVDVVVVSLQGSSAPTNFSYH